MNAKINRQRDQAKSDKENTVGLLYAAGGTLTLIVAFVGLLRGRDLATEFGGATMGLGFLGGALGYLGEAPSAPSSRRIYKAVRGLIPLSVLVILTWLLFS